MSSDGLAGQGCAAALPNWRAAEGAALAFTTRDPFDPGARPYRAPRCSAIGTAYCGSVSQGK